MHGIRSVELARRRESDVERLDAGDPPTHLLANLDERQKFMMILLSAPRLRCSVTRRWYVAFERLNQDAAVDDEEGAGYERGHVGS